MSDWKKVEVGSSWDYKEKGKGAELIGIYRGKEEHVGKNDANVYTFDVNGEFISVWVATVLDIRLKNLRFGEEVRIVYLGSFPSPNRKGKSYHSFDVYHRMPEMQKVTTEYDEPEN